MMIRIKSPDYRVKAPTFPDVKIETSKGSEPEWGLKKIITLKIPDIGYRI